MIRALSISICFSIFMGSSAPVAWAGNLTYNFSFSAPATDVSEEFPLEGEIHVFGTITTDGTLGLLTHDNFVGGTMSASFDTESIGPLGDQEDDYVSFLFHPDDEIPTLFADENNLYWNALASDSPYISDFNFYVGRELGDGVIEEIQVAGWSGSGIAPTVEVFIGRTTSIVAALSDGEVITPSAEEVHLFYADGDLFLPDVDNVFVIATLATVPEPSAFSLALIAGLGFAWRWRRA